MEKPITKSRWVDERRIYVETPLGDDFIVGFMNDQIYRCQKQAPWFNVDVFVAHLFDKYYKGNIKEEWNAIYKEMVKEHLGTFFTCQPFDKEALSKDRIRIGRRIKDLREAKGLDAKRLAFFAGIDAANLCRIEAGKYSVGFDILSKIGYALGMEIDFVEPKREDQDGTH